MSNIEVEILGPTGGAPATTVELARDGRGRFVSSTASSAPTTVEIQPSAKPASAAMSEAVRDRIAALRSGGAPPAPKEAAAPAPATPPADAPAAEPATPPPEPAAASPGDPPVAVDAAPVEDPPADDAPADEEAAPAEAAAEPAAAPEPDKPAAPPDWHEERADLEGLAKRQRGIIERLESELAAAKKGGAPTSAAEARLKLLEEAEDLYFREPAKAARKIVAAINGFGEDSPDLKSELDDLFIDLTAEVGGVTPDPAHTAKRTSALTRREWDRKKQREAGDKPKATEEVAASAPSEPNDEAGLPLVRDSFKPIAAKYPHLTALAAYDGTTAEEVLWDLLKKGVKRGEFDPDEKDNTKLVAQAARRAEAFYTRRAEKLPEGLRKALLSTATPGVPATKQDPPAAAPSKNDKRQGNGRALSNADASVAPKQTPPPAKEPERPIFKSDAERARWATRHLRGEK